MFCCKFRILLVTIKYFESILLLFRGKKNNYPRNMDKMTDKLTMRNVLA